MPFTFTRLAIPDVVSVEPRIFADDRGYFMETYKKSEFEKFGINLVSCQDNQSMSKKGVVRGLHYQMDPVSQGKLLSVISGSGWEVAVDIRKGSPTFGKWVGVTLSSKTKNMVWIPPGFAAGMVVLEDDTVLSYKTTAEYSKADERGILWNDPAIGIEWPKLSDFPELTISDKDKINPLLKDAEINFVYKKG